MVMNVSKDVYKVDVYPDADFSRMYGMKITLILPVQRAVPDSSLLYQTVLFIGNHNCRQRQVFS
jgi:hypothetical protein